MESAKKLTFSRWGRRLRSACCVLVSLFGSFIIGTGQADAQLTGTRTGHDTITFEAATGVSCTSWKFVIRRGTAWITVGSWSITPSTDWTTSGYYRVKSGAVATGTTWTVQRTGLASAWAGQTIKLEFTFDGLESSTTQVLTFPPYVPDLPNDAITFSSTEELTYLATCTVELFKPSDVEVYVAKRATSGDVWESVGVSEFSVSGVGSWAEDTNFEYIDNTSLFDATDTFAVTTERLMPGAYQVKITVRVGATGYVNEEWYSDEFDVEAPPDPWPPSFEELHGTCDGALDCTNVRVQVFPVGQTNVDDSGPHTRRFATTINEWCDYTPVGGTGRIFIVFDTAEAWGDSQFSITGLDEITGGTSTVEGSVVVRLDGDVVTLPLDIPTGVHDVEILWTYNGLKETTDPELGMSAVGAQFQIRGYAGTFVHETVGFDFDRPGAEATLLDCGEEPPPDDCDGCCAEMLAKLDETIAALIEIRDYTATIATEVGDIKQTLDESLIVQTDIRDLLDEMFGSFDEPIVIADDDNEDGTPDYAANKPLAVEYYSDSIEFNYNGSQALGQSEIVWSHNLNAGPLGTIPLSIDTGYLATVGQFSSYRALVRVWVTWIFGIFISARVFQILSGA